jgi:hypothetical protein
MRPGTRHFIGPLTPAQQRRRKRNQESFRVIHDIVEARGYSYAEVFRNPFLCKITRRIEYESA